MTGRLGHGRPALRPAACVLVLALALVAPGLVATGALGIGAHPSADRVPAHADNPSLGDLFAAALPGPRDGANDGASGGTTLALAVAPTSPSTCTGLGPVACYQAAQGAQTQVCTTGILYACFEERRTHYGDRACETDPSDRRDFDEVRTGSPNFMNVRVRGESYCYHQGNWGRGEGTRVHAAVGFPPWPMTTVTWEKETVTDHENDAAGSHCWVVWTYETWPLGEGWGLEPCPAGMAPPDPGWGHLVTS